MGILDMEGMNSKRSSQLVIDDNPYLSIGRKR